MDILNYCFEWILNIQDKVVPSLNLVKHESENIKYKGMTVTYRGDNV